MEIERGTVRAPELGPEWLNSTPLSTRGLRGSVVLVDFWDYTCVNCLRTLPYLAAWHERYAPMGLVTIGVHTPEFAFAQSRELVEQAVDRLGIRYPVVMDNHYAIWQSFANRCWPAKYLIDASGYMRLAHFGEGEYQETELAIQELLREIHPGAEMPPPLEPLRASDHPGAACYRPTPELYLGLRRGQPGNEGGFQKQGEGEPFEYALPRDLRADAAYFGGAWMSAEDHARSAGDMKHPSTLLVYYAAKEVNLVMASLEGEQEVELLQDGGPVAQEEAGEDVRFDATGRATVTVSEPRMYRLTRNRAFGQRLLQLVSRQPGLLAYAFTFVTCPADESGAG